MILTKVELKNFKKHKNLTVNLTGGLNTIHGPNYSGKSTIQQAILYALYGTIVVPCKGDDIGTKGTDAKPEVTLYFTMNEKEYTVKRSGSEATLSSAEGVLSRSASAVSKEVEKMMGLTKDQFLKTRISKQGDAHALLSTGTQELKKLVETLSGCEIVDKINKKATAELKTITDKVEVLNSTIDLSVDVDELKAELDQAVELEQQYIVKKDVAEEAKNKARAALRNTDDALNKVRSLYNIYLASVTEKDRLEATHTELQSQLSTLNASPDFLSDEVFQEIKNKEKSLLTDKESITKLNIQIEFNTEGRHTEMVKLSKLNIQLEDLTGKQITNYIPAIEDMQSKLRVALGNETSAKLTLSQHLNAEVDGVCSKCKRPLGEMSLEEIQAHEVETAQAKEQVETIAAEVRAIERHIKNLEAQQKEMDEISSQVSSTKEKIFTLEQSINKFSDTLDELGEVREFDNKPLVVVKTTLNAHSDIVMQISTLTPRLMMVKSQMSKLEVPEKPDVDTLQNLRHVQEELLNVASMELFNLMDAYGSSNAEVARLKAEYKKYQETHQRVATLLNDGSGYKAIVKVVKENRAKMMEGIWAGLLEETSQFVTSCTSGDVTAVTVDDKFNLVYKEGEHVFPIESASGAQKSLIGMGLRLAIVNMLPSNVEFIMVDEITSDMTPEISAIAMAVVRTQCSQTVAISHRLQDLTTSDNIISL